MRHLDTVYANPYAFALDDHHRFVTVKPMLVTSSRIEQIPIASRALHRIGEELRRCRNREC